MSGAADVVVVLCTAPEEAGPSLADTLLAERLVACVNLLGPVRSRYRWQGAIEQGEETLLLMKTLRSLAPRLRRRIAELHPYEVPEVLELEVTGGLADYLAWVAESCAAGEGGD